MQCILSIWIFNQMTFVISLDSNREARFFMNSTLYCCECTSTYLDSHTKVFKS
jgi:hypothetical protein